MQSGILARPTPALPGIVAGEALDQEASEEAVSGAAGSGGNRRSTARHRSGAGTGFMSTGAASRIRKFAYSGV